MHKFIRLTNIAINNYSDFYSISNFLDEYVIQLHEFEFKKEKCITGYGRRYKHFTEIEICKINKCKLNNYTDFYSISNFLDKKYYHVTPIHLF